MDRIWPYWRLPNVALGSHKFVERQLAGFEIKVFMARGGTYDQAKDVRDSIEKLPLTSKVQILSRDAEYAALKRSLNADFMSGVIDNPLPYALKVECKDSRKTTVLADQIRHIRGVNNVADAKEQQGKVRGIADLVRTLGFFAAIVLCFTTIFIIHNAIRLTLFARRHEIRIMQLVGATNWFIRVPLVLEGIVIGALGALIAVGLISLGSEYVAGTVQRLLPTLRDMSSGIASSQLLGMLVTAGAAIGAAGSLVSMRRFLKV